MPFIFVNPVFVPCTVHTDKTDSFPADIFLAHELRNYISESGETPASIRNLNMHVDKTRIKKSVVVFLGRAGHGRGGQDRAGQGRAGEGRAQRDSP